MKTTSRRGTRRFASEAFSAARAGAGRPAGDAAPRAREKFDVARVAEDAPRATRATRARDVVDRFGKTFFAAVRFKTTKDFGIGEQYSERVPRSARRAPIAVDATAPDGSGETMVHRAARNGHAMSCVCWCASSGRISMCDARESAPRHARRRENGRVRSPVVARFEVPRLAAPRGGAHGIVVVTNASS